MKKQEKLRMIGIACFIVAVAVTFLLFDRLVRSGPEQTGSEPEGFQAKDADGDSLLQQKGPLASEEDAPWSKSIKKSKRTIWDYIRRRAYPGAPPVIPHKLTENERVADENCLSCHGEGGYSEKFEAFAPVSPHLRDEFKNCTQCHTPVNTEAPFRQSNWKTVSPPETNQRTIPTAPPQIPHDLQNRSFCASCHAGPGAVQSLRSDHAHLSNCRQCHQPRNTDQTWSRDK